MPQESLNYAITELFKEQASDMGAWSGKTPRHNNMVHHQLSLVSSGTLAAGVYNVRITVFEGDVDLRNSVDIDRALTIAGSDSAYVNFSGIIRGLHLEVATPLTGGETISAVLTSSMINFNSEVTITV